jgi:hypothetical protein
MEYVYGMQNLTFGADGGLTKGCQAKHPDEPWLCFMSPHMQDAIQTPFFMVRSQSCAVDILCAVQSISCMLH